MTTQAPPPAAVVWRGDGASAEASQRALQRYASAHGLQLTIPRAEHAARGSAVRMEIGDEIDRQIAAAQAALAGDGVELAERHLAAAEASLLAHPELPHAAWLLAELRRAWASYHEHTSPPRADLAAEARADAVALADVRAAGPGEAPSAPRGRHVLRVLHDEKQALFVDAKAFPPEGASVVAGPHHVVVREHGGGVLFATFLHVLTETTLRVPEVNVHAPCSLGDFEGLGAPGGVARAPRCERWLSCEEIPGGVRIALCRGAQCAPSSDWSASPTTPFLPGPTPPKATPWPRWLTWGLVGAGALGLTAAGLAAGGVFSDRPRETRFVSGGLELR